MPTEGLSLLGAGSFNNTTLAWTDSVFGFAAIGGASSYWSQFDKELAVTEKPTALSVTILPQFDEAATLSVYGMLAPMYAVFSSSNLPGHGRGRTLSSTHSITMQNGIQQVVTLPLYDSLGKTNIIGATLGQKATPGTQRLGLGFDWSGAGGNVAITIATLTYTGPFTGKVGLVGTAGQDRAVECPRCGQAVLETELIRDGVTRQPVCPACYDPPPEPPTFQFPFRS